MSHLVIEIMKDFEQPIARTIKQGQPDERTVFDQRAFMYNGGPFPVEFRISLDRPENAYAVGKYVLDVSSFSVGRWGDLEIARKPVLKAAQPHELKQVS